MPSERVIVLILDAERVPVTPGVPSVSSGGHATAQELVHALVEDVSLL